MKFLKPSWLVHSDSDNQLYEIYSVHVSPNNRWLASGGLDGQVRIWSTAEIESGFKTSGNVENNDGSGSNSLSATTASQEKVKHQPLCVLEGHKGAVTVVRFSPCGKYMASGSDDKSVIIWKLDEEVNADDDSTTTANSSNKSTQSNKIPNWKFYRQLNGHDNDVQDLAWSPDCSLLVSVGLDSRVVVWSGPNYDKNLNNKNSDAINSNSSNPGSNDNPGCDPAFQELERFDDMHKSHVKGVSFDPANRYFATASDDKTVKIVKYQRIKRSKTTATTLSQPSSNQNSSSNNSTFSAFSNNKSLSNNSTKANHTTPVHKIFTFSVETTISSPFKDSPSSTYYRRCSWSPDGNHISAANATNKPRPTVTIINRESWESDISLVGHESPCQVASFCPKIFCLDQYSLPKNNGKKSNEDSNDNSKDNNSDTTTPHEYTSLISVIATAGQDKTLAIWNTSNPRPLLVATNVAEKAITDIAWSGDGYTLYVSSLDGSILVARFKQGELGWVAPLEANRVQLERYQVGEEEEEEEEGEEDDKEVEVKEVVETSAAETNSVAKPVTEKEDNDDQDIEMISETQKPAATNSTTTEISKDSKDSKDSKHLEASKLVEAPKVTTKDGKKRIAPTLISDSLIPYSLSTNKPNQQTNNNNSTNNLPSSSSHQQTVEQAIENAPISNTLPKKGVSTLVIGTKRRGNILEDSKALDLETNNSGNNNNNSNNSNNSGNNDNNNDNNNNSGNNNNNYNNINTNGNTSSGSTNKNADGSTDNNKLPEDGTRMGTNKRMKLEEVKYIRPAVMSPASAVSQVRVGVPKIKTFFARRGILKDSNTNNTNTTNNTNDNTITTLPPAVPILQIRNSPDDNNHYHNNNINDDDDHFPTRVTATCANTLLFTDFLPRYAVLAAGSGDKFWAVATEDGSIYVYSPAGRRLCPPIVLGASVSFLESEGDILVAISAVGMVHVWDVMGGRKGGAVNGFSNFNGLNRLTGVKNVGPCALYPPVSLAPVLDGGSRFADDGVLRAPKMTHAAVTSHGQPVVTLSNGSSFVYSGELMMWTRVSDSWWAGTSQFWDSGSSGNDGNGDDGLNNSGDNSRGLITLLEHRTSSESILSNSHHHHNYNYNNFARNRMPREGYEAFETQVSVSHLENRMAAALIARSWNEYAAFAKVYAVKIAELGMASKLEELCEELWGSGRSGSVKGNGTGNGKVVEQKNKKRRIQDVEDMDLSGNDVTSLLGSVTRNEEEEKEEEEEEQREREKEKRKLIENDKHKLLKEIVLVTGKYRQVQSVISKYAVAVGVISNVDKI